MSGMDAQSARLDLHGSCAPEASAHSNLALTRARDRDLDQVASVIARAVDAWPAPARLKRRVLPVLRYSALDLLDHEILLVTDAHRPIAVGAWQFDSPMADPDRRQSALLHGLFVAREAQRRRVGQWLQAVIAQRASAAGFHGLHVKAERFAVSYFEHCGYRRLQPGEQPREGGSAYPYWFWQACPRLSWATANS